MIKKDSSDRVVCLTCSRKAVEGSDYCRECLDTDREKLGLEIPDLFEDVTETLRDGIDSVAETLVGVDNGRR